MANESGEYGALYSLTCILYEGAITVTTTGTHKAAGTDLDPSFAFAAEINNGDYVGLHIDVGNTALLTGFLPVVTTVAAANPVIGRVINEPEWSNAPQATQNVWATQLAGGYYRTAEVEFMTVTNAHCAQIEGTTDVEVGAPLKWDLSEDAWVDAGTTFTGCFSFHYQPDADSLEGLVGFGQYAGTVAADDTAGIDTIA